MTGNHYADWMTPPTAWTAPVYSGFIGRERARLREQIGAKLQVPPEVLRPSNAEIEQKIANFKLVADALELLLKLWPEIPGASVTLSPDTLEELKRILLSLPASVAL